MTKKQQHHPSFFIRFIHGCERLIIRYPWTLLIVSLLLCVGTSYYVYKYLSINTSTKQMLSPDLPFQKNQRRLDEAFPHDAETFIFVVGSNTPEETTQAAVKLAGFLSQEKQQFDGVYIPSENDFFHQHALLYLEQVDLEDLAKKLTDAQPFIGHLAQNYSLNGLFEIIAIALNKHDEKLPMDLKPLLTTIDDSLTPSLAGQAHALSWQTLLADNRLSTEARQKLVIALPLLLGMGIDSSILIMHRLHFNLQEDENLLHSSSTTRGIIFSSITTLCSFSSLSFTDHQGMASMVLLLSIGLFFTVLCSLIVLPAFSGKRV
jgi:uncharacterized membrane protein YdfJ with MMPL/SSD domain